MLQTAAGATLHTITISTSVSTTLALYDNQFAAGTPLVSITTSASGTYTIDAPLVKGLVATLSASASNATIVLQ